MNTKRKNNITSLIGLSSIMGVTLLSGIVLSSAKVSADGDSAVDEVTITVPTACSMTSTVNTAHTAEIANGQYNSSIGETNIKTVCNDNSGFAIYAIGYTSDTLGNNKLTNTTLGSDYDIITGTGLTGNSQWAMKLTPVSTPTPTYPIIIAGSTADTLKEQGDPDFTSFQQVPDDYTKVAYRTAGTDTGTNAEGANFTTTYQAYISPTQAAGTYTGKVKYVLVHPSSAAAPQQPQGHCTDADTCMQQQTAVSLAQKLPNTGSTTTLYDSRDGKAYTVAKLADGKYWMTTNLDIAGDTALSADDTDVTSAYISNFTTSNNLAKADDTIVLPSSAIKNSDNNYLTDNTQFSQDNYSYVFNSDNKIDCGPNNPCYSYYSWDAATLGSGRNIDTNNTDSEQSICPRGWKLPTSRNTETFDATIATQSDYYGLATSYGMSTDVWSEFTHSFIAQAGPGTVPDYLLTGMYYDSGSYGYGHGFYWSSTSFSETDSAFMLRFNDLSVSSQDGAPRRCGLSVRCLFGGAE